MPHDTPPAPSLRATPFTAAHVLVTGATGYVGAMVVASLLRDSAARISCLVRTPRPAPTLAASTATATAADTAATSAATPHATAAGGAIDRAAVLAPIADAWQQQSGSRWSAAVEQRIRLVRLPDELADLPELARATLRGVDEIVHCAGCLDCHDGARLRAANLWYTAHLVALARRLRPRRLVYVSTAFSGGYLDGADDGSGGVIAEAPLAEPRRDPTPYTLTKRQAERLVAASGIPFVVIRPSVLIGDSTSGHYDGKRYGLYQQWASLAELVCDRWHAEFHTVASDARVNLLHQDAFCAAFKAAHRWLPDGAYFNLVSEARTAPTLRELWDLWFTVTRPAAVHHHARLADVPLRRIDLRQRTYLTFAKVNLEIAAHRWAFETGWLDRLRANGLCFADATPRSVQRCQDRFVAESAQIARCRGVVDAAVLVGRQPVAVDPPAGPAHAVPARAAAG